LVFTGRSAICGANLPRLRRVEGIGLISVFVGSYLWLFRGSLRFPQAFILLPCGILVIWLVNAVRITLLVLFGAYVSPQIALAGFHSATGWIGFLAVALGIVAVTRADPLLRGKAIRGRNGGPRG
jgi:exosortase/archaeosortase family protein